MNNNLNDILDAYSESVLQEINETFGKLSASVNTSQQDAFKKKIQKTNLKASKGIKDQGANRSLLSSQKKIKPKSPEVKDQKVGTMSPFTVTGKQ